MAAEHSRFLAHRSAVGGQSVQRGALFHTLRGPASLLPGAPRVPESQGLLHPGSGRGGGGGALGWGSVGQAWTGKVPQPFTGSSWLS